MYFKLFLIPTSLSCAINLILQLVFISGKPVLGQLVDDYLLDFDIFHVSHCTELLHYIDAKYLDNQMGGSNPADVDTWLSVQQHVDSFTISATKIAKRLATFVKLLNQEDISHHKNKDKIQEASVFIAQSLF